VQDGGDDVSHPEAQGYDAFGYKGMESVSVPVIHCGYEECFDGGEQWVEMRGLSVG